MVGEVPQIDCRAGIGDPLVQRRNVALGSGAIVVHGQNTVVGEFYPGTFILVVDARRAFGPGVGSRIVNNRDKGGIRVPTDGRNQHVSVGQDFTLGISKTNQSLWGFGPGIGDRIEDLGIGSAGAVFAAGDQVSAIAQNGGRVVFA